MLSQMIPASSLGKSQPLLGPEDTHGHIHIPFHTKTSRLQNFHHLYSKIHPANSLVYQRLKTTTKTLQRNLCKTISYCILVNLLIFSIYWFYPWPAGHTQLLSEFIPNPDFIKETLMIGQVLIFFDCAGQTQQLDQPAAVHLQLVDVATSKNLDKNNHENHREIHTGVQHFNTK